MAFPSSYKGLILPAVPAFLSSPEVTFEPKDAWMASDTKVNCTTKDLTYTTSLINSTVSFNYSGNPCSLELSIAIMLIYAMSRSQCRNPYY
jgi:hypothetical protein